MFDTWFDTWSALSPRAQNIAIYVLQMGKANLDCSLRWPVVAAILRAKCQDSIQTVNSLDVKGPQLEGMSFFWKSLTAN